MHRALVARTPGTPRLPAHSDSVPQLSRETLGTGGVSCKSTGLSSPWWHSVPPAPPASQGIEPEIQVISRICGLVSVGCFPSPPFDHGVAAFRWHFVVDFVFDGGLGSRRRRRRSSRSKGAGRASPPFQATQRGCVEPVGLASARRRGHVLGGHRGHGRPIRRGGFLFPERGTGR